MKVAVTGVSGFIGRHVLSELVNRDVKLIAVTRNASRLKNVVDSVTTVEMDISKPGMNDYDRLHRPDLLLHLAWDGLPNYRSLKHFETELPRQYHFLKGLVEAGLPSMLISGTCFEYGDQAGALSETMTPQPNNPYGYAKNALRQQLEFLQTEHSFSLTWARLFYTYGEGQSEHSLFSQLQRSVARGDEVFKMTAGDQLRDYMPVTDVAALLATLALSTECEGIVNICSGTPISVHNLVQEWIRTYAWSIKLDLGSYPYLDHEPKSFWGSRTKLDSVLRKCEHTARDL